MYLSRCLCHPREAVMCIYVCIHMCMHPLTHTSRCVHVFMGMQTGIYPWFRLACGSNTTTPWVLSSTQLVFIHQGNTQACTLLLPLHACVSAGEGDCGLQHTSLFGSGVLRTCVRLWLDSRCRHWDTGVAFVLLRTRERTHGQAQDLNHCHCSAFVYALSLSPKDKDHNKAETKVIQDQCLACSHSAGQTCLQVCKQAGQEELREPEVMVVTGPHEPQVGIRWGCLGSGWKKLLRDLGKVCSHNKGITALRK